MITALIVPADMNQPLRLHELEASDLAGFQALVSGAIEAVTLDRPAATLYLNEEGKYLQLPLNSRATAIASVHNAGFCGRDVAVGNGVLVGGLDASGHDTTLPARYRQLWLEANAFRVEYRLVRGRWHRKPQYFDDVYVAYIYALRLALRDPFVEAVRVMPRA